MDAIEVESLCRTFAGRTVVDNVSFKVRENSIHGFVGANGAGKTTLLNLIAGLETADSGTVIFEGHDLTSIRNVFTSHKIDSARHT